MATIYDVLVAQNVVSVGWAMPILPRSQLVQAEWLSRVGYTNPFLADRIELEARVLGDDFVRSSARIQYQPRSSVDEMFPNAGPLRQLTERLVDKMRSKLLAAYDASEQERIIYRDLAMYALYTRYMSRVVDVPFDRYGQRLQQDVAKSFADFCNSFRHYFELPGQQIPNVPAVEIVFAGLFQIERAFFHVFRYIIGGTLEAARLRAAVWQSVFTHDMQRYSRGLFRVMGEIPTLITGPSGTGKELVARAIAYSRFVEFDSKSKRFVTDYQTSFYGLNVSALSSELIESELYGHVKGSFTGASCDRAGILDPAVCRPEDTVFLDEIGELDPRIQVKLLRVLQEREFQRVGDVEVQRFVGKVVAATNRDLALEMREGRFREDLYYRLCADRIETPSLRSQLQESQDDLVNFVRFIARQFLAGMEDEIESLTADSINWIQENLGPDYPWSGNIRELEQCVRSVMIRGRYSPPRIDEVGDRETLHWRERFLADVRTGRLTRAQLDQAYCKLVYEQLGNYEAAAERLGVDSRTVRRFVTMDSSRD